MTCNCSEPSDLSATLFSIGKLQRANPLPVGVYWLDVIGDRRSQFAEFLFDNANRINVLATESFDEQGGFPARDWYKFQVSEPTPFDNSRYGFPNIIEPGDDITSSADTADIQTPPNECDINCRLERGAMVAGGLLVAALIYTIVRR